MHVGGKVSPGVEPLLLGDVGVSPHPGDGSTKPAELVCVLAGFEVSRLQNGHDVVVDGAGHREGVLGIQDEVLRELTRCAARLAGDTPVFAAGPRAFCVSGFAEGANGRTAAVLAVLDGGAELVGIHAPAILGRVVQGRGLLPVKGELARCSDERAWRVGALRPLEVAAPMRGLGHGDWRRTGR